MRLDPNRAADHSADALTRRTIVVAEGFLMLVDPESVRHFDVRFFMREDHAVLKKRREERHGYVSPEGSVSYSLPRLTLPHADCSTPRVRLSHLFLLHFRALTRCTDQCSRAQRGLCGGCVIPQTRGFQPFRS